MCLAIPGRVEEILNEGRPPHRRVNFGASSSGSAWTTFPTSKWRLYHCPRWICALKDRRESAEETLEIFRQMAARRGTGAARKKHSPARQSAPIPLSRLPPQRQRPVVGDPDTELLRPMKYLTEFRNGEIARAMAREIHSITTRPWKIMEVCGGQTTPSSRTASTRCFRPASR